MHYPRLHLVLVLISTNSWPPKWRQEHFRMLSSCPVVCLLLTCVSPPPYPQVSALQSALERSQASESTLTARLAELNSQLASSSLEGGSLRAQNGELLSELAALRCVACQSINVGMCVVTRSSCPS